MVNGRIISLFKIKKMYAVTGTFHGSIIYAKSEGDARRAFHNRYSGESITHIRRVFYYPE